MGVGGAEKKSLRETERTGGLGIVGEKRKSLKRDDWIRKKSDGARKKKRKVEKNLKRNGDREGKLGSHKIIQIQTYTLSLGELYCCRPISFVRCVFFGK